MSTPPEQIKGNKISAAVCPESSIESVGNVGTLLPPRKTIEKSKIENIRATTSRGCESTIESSQRRGFILKAAMAAAAIGVGATLVGKNLVPESSAASPPGVSQDCDYVANYSLVADALHSNSGTSPYPGLQFAGGGSGEGIGSNRNCSGTLPYYTLDFYTGSVKRMIITNSGQVGIGNNPVPLPGTTLCVQGVVSAFCYFNANTTNGSGGLAGGIKFGGCSGEGISSDRYNTSPDQNGLDFYTSFTKRMSITNNGNVGIGTPVPGHSLCVIGTICGGFSCGPFGTLGACGIGVIGESFTCRPGVFGSSSTGSGVAGVSCGTGVSGSSNSGYGVNGNSASGAGVAGSSTSGIGVCGGSGTSFGVQARSSSPLTGKFKNNATSGDRSALVQFETGDTTVVDWNFGVSGKGNGLSIPDGDFYIEQQGKGARMVIDSNGHVGIGTTSPTTLLDVAGPTLVKGKLGVGGIAKTSLNVKGSISAKLVSETKSYTMTASDFGVLANANAGAITITLPPASTASGMMVFVKKSDKSTNSVTVSAAGSDKIEGATSKPLATQYASLTLVSNGKSPGVWYIISNAA